ncbi:dim gamma-tubulin 4 [Musca autumnalis]|uniref:dim gamma-tubulin 4 n=1 Tax=Musca autumnalis TaxID=221902 RepID=UPI003CEBA62B
MSFAAPSTPTKSKSNSSQLQTSVGAGAAHNLDDINMLLFLEATKRKAENETAIMQKIEESYKIYQRRRHEYTHLYSRYVELLKKAATRRVLKEHGVAKNMDLNKAMEDARNIREKLNSGSATDYIDKEELEKFKKLISSGNKHDNLRPLRMETTELKVATKAIQSSIESTEAAIDNGINQCLDLFTEELDMENFPNLYRMHETENN